MAFFVIAGKPDCPAFVHVAHVANYLEDHLPNFNVNILQKRTGDWEPWLEGVNAKNDWQHYKSPIIWKELVLRGGKAHYIGGISEFWEYCYDYYGLESILSKEDLQKLVQDNMQYYDEMKEFDKTNATKIRHVGIAGASNKMTISLLPELLKLKDLWLPRGLVIYLYDSDLDEQDVLEQLDLVVDDSSEISANGNVKTVQVASSMSDLLKDCELLIVLDDIVKKPDEDESDWIIRNISKMYMLADDINAFAIRNLKVVLATQGLVCLHATVLLEACTTIRIQNIVAITSDLGLGPLSVLSQQTGVALNEFGGPPVWGFIGVNQFIDVDSIIMMCDIYRPFVRAVKNVGGSTLPLGIIQPELRFASYLIDDADDIYSRANIIKENISTHLERQPIFAKVRATVSLLKLWFSKKSPNEIISLAVCCNGQYGIPSGLAFSQPVILENGKWEPFKNFPLNPKAQEEITKLIPPVMQLLEHLNVGQCVPQT